MKIKMAPQSRKDAGLGQVVAAWVLAAVTLAAPALVQAKDAPIPPGAVLSVMENIQFDDQADTGELEDGAVATFWYGHELDLDGKHYYTAFVWHTRDSAARQGEDFAAPEVQVRLAEATFERTHPGQTQAYTLRYIERKIGFFGAREKPEDVDPARPALEHRTADGRLLLAVPTSTFDSGVIFNGYTLFVFNPKKTEDDNGWIWTFIGQVHTGEDNSAACDEGAVMPCTFSKGELSFVDGQGAMPQVKVTVSGTTFDGPDSTRPLAAADNLTYVYDGQKRQYISNQ
ncbi:hypothetical protein [Pseudomonas sp. CF161]|uniref:hypothetical protein n=1 Tax=Pseudomonas sp. CF161 TaxID=911241 RepID=UPI0003552312|nr:hypothetical protein [Pseudomonas sp. CF161]EPL07190.1 hypothetical protein CF161_18319 [Pseudomonas sp. CF161]